MGWVYASREGVRSGTARWLVKKARRELEAREPPLSNEPDGEAVIWNAGTVDFGAVQARAASTLDRARALAAGLPATCAAFDVLAHPGHGGDALAARPFTERRTDLVGVMSWPTSARRFLQVSKAGRAGWLSSPCLASCADCARSRSTVR